MDSPLARVLRTGSAGYLGSAFGILFVFSLCRVLNTFVGDSFAYILLSAVVAFSAWYIGVGPAILATILAVAGIADLFILFSHTPRNAAQYLALIAFVFTSAAIIAAGEARRRHNQKLQAGHTDLEGRVRERTAELDSANENLRELSGRLLQMQDEERRRIARELHDSVGQLLASLSMNVSRFRAEFERFAKAATLLTDNEALIQEMSQEVRTMSHLLHPPLLDEAGLSSAIRWYVEGFAKRSNITVELLCPENFGRMPSDIETAMFRIVQECLTNIHRHSESRVAKVHCRHFDGQVIVEVTDEGIGISVEKLRAMTSTGNAGVGIRGMRERLRQLGGGLNITSDSSGTTIAAHLPVPKESALTSTSLVPDKSKAAA